MLIMTHQLNTVVTREAWKSRVLLCCNCHNQKWQATMKSPFSLYSYKRIRFESKQKRDEFTMCRNNATHFHFQVLWMDERTKGPALQGCGMQTSTVKCLMSCPGFWKNHMWVSYTTCPITQGSTQHPVRCQIPRFLPCLRDFADGFWNLFQNHNARVSRKPFLNSNPVPAPPESHTGKNNV